LKKWPKARLYCSEKDLCWPIEAEEKIITKTTRDNNDKKVHFK